ncbi:helix-turn-helix domain-containing protein [Bacillus sp. IBL03825]|uniref:helix-turn-helix domain-containing protein n=1 Tax=Bacillus sp. IBL03825 TaxID=2953580 RepID=UPI002157C2C8|nr:helix-turn-helix transcriptional regulator [Bacillus sp. IBL03825]MCR6850473.1 helix-turn-helix transcriptional regulator [Bacillus sp. IBL03825]
MKYKIKELRKQNGDTLKTLAEKINYDYSNLSKIERGIYTPSLDLLKNISEVYGVEICYLLGSEKQEYSEISGSKSINKIDLNSPELLQRYILMLDGKTITKSEHEFMVEIIRKLRKMIMEQQNNRD